MQRVIESLKKAEVELATIPICSWGKIPNNKIIGKRYATRCKKFLPYSLIDERLREILEPDDIGDLFFGAAIYYSEMDDTDDLFAWRQKMSKPISYYIEKIETAMENN